MDHNEDMDDDLDQIWCELEPEIEVSKSSFPPTRSLGFLFLLTAGLGGLQGIFALIFSNGSAHLRDLGLSKPVQALVWIAGPIAGMTVQPYCGIRSDQCLSPWGRRRPFIASGAIAAVASLLGLASAERLATVLVRLYDSSRSSADAHFHEESAKVAAPVAASIAVFFIIALNVALQPLQGGLRTLIVDVCPRAQQPTATAVAGTVVSASNILCYATGFVDLRRIAGLRALGGDSQFAILCIVTSAALAVLVGLTCLSVRERSAALGVDVPYAHSVDARGMKNTVRAQLWYLCTSFPLLPRQVQQIFKVQFFSWIGWFPFLLYTTTYISETYKHDMTAVQRLNKDFQVKAARMGSLGLMLFAMVALVAGGILSIAHKHANRVHNRPAPASLISPFIRLARSIRHMWIISHVLFAICMFATAFVSSLSGVYILVGLSGISWAVTIWAPYILLSAHIVRDNGSRGNAIYSEPLVPLLQNEEDSLREDDRQHAIGVEKEGVDDACERRPGIIFGLHNAAIAGPQIAAAAGCSLIFWMLEGSSQDSVGWTLRAGGLAALGAAIVAVGMRKEVPESRLKRGERLVVGTSWRDHR